MGREIAEHELNELLELYLYLHEKTIPDMTARIKLLLSNGWILEVKGIESLPLNNPGKQKGRKYFLELIKHQVDVLEKQEFGGKRYVRIQGRNL